MTHYACHSTPRSANTPLAVQDGWTDDGRRIMRTHEPVWLPIKCGHVAQAGRGSDERCAGCANRGF